MRQASQLWPEGDRLLTLGGAFAKAVELFDHGCSIARFLECFHHAALNVLPGRVSRAPASDSFIEMKKRLKNTSTCCNLHLQAVAFRCPCMKLLNFKGKYYFE